MNLVIRADASVDIGTGHIMRCLALAQAWQEAGGDAVFAMAMDAPSIEKRLAEEGFEVERVAAEPGSSEDAAAAARLAQEGGASWVVVDGYHFGYDYQRALKDAGLRVLFVDDNGHAGRYCADIVLNQNIHADESMYAKRAPETRLLLGTRYVLLRKEFRAWREWKREIPEVARKVLVTLGGSDPDNVTLKVIEALGLVQGNDLEAVVVAGGSNPHYDELCAAAADSPASIRVQRNVADMAELMAWADVAVSAAGSTCWELAFMGLPAALVTVAENQRQVAEGMQEEGAALNLGSHESISRADLRDRLAELLESADTRRSMSARGRGLVDGEGAHRVVRAMRGARLTLRRATEQDARLLWEWANDPVVREASFTSNPIPWGEHVHWLSRKLGDSDCFHFIALEEGDVPIGQVRFDVADGKADIDVSVAEEKRGMGFGSAIIRMGVEELTRTAAVGTVHAFVKAGNRASIRAFKEAGFQNRGEGNAKGHACVHLIWKRNEG